MYYPMFYSFTVQSLGYPKRKKMKNSLVYFISILLIAGSGCASKQTVLLSSENNTEIVSKAMKENNKLELNIKDSCLKVGGRFDITSTETALPHSLAITCKDFLTNDLNDFNNYSNSYLTNYGLILNHSSNGFKEKPIIRKTKSNKYITWTLTSPLKGSVAKFVKLNDN